MPVEIRELVIKTEIKSRVHHNDTNTNSENLQTLKKDLLKECLRSLGGKSPASNFER